MHADGNRLNELSGGRYRLSIYRTQSARSRNFWRSGNALAHELRKTGLAVMQQRVVTVIYDGIAVGE